MMKRKKRPLACIGSATSMLEHKYSSIWHDEVTQLMDGFAFGKDTEMHQFATFQQSFTIKSSRIPTLNSELRRHQFTQAIKYLVALATHRSEP